MKLITRNDIERWAEQIDSKGNLPFLISRLVIAITPKSTIVDFPSGSAAYIGGWDGSVNCQEDVSYVPKGISLWEFGTEEDNKGKADDDYKKRTNDPLGHDKSNSTFIFVTPRYWKFKDKWKQSKLKEGEWKDIKVYDSNDLEQWLDGAPAVSRWFSVFTRGYPFDGILTVERFWKEWSWSPQRELIPKIVTSGRENESKLLFDFLANAPGIKAIRASSKDEAIAFIIATAKQFEPRQSEDFFSKSLIIDTSANFRSISINKHSLILISRIEETNILYGGVSDGHHVLVPLGADDTFNQDIITLPPIDRDGQIDSLMLIGLSDEEAVKFSKESGRNITVLKRLLKFPQNKLEWTKFENVREIIPAMLLGRWDETKKGDIEILEKLSGEKYPDYIQKVAKWKDYEVAPFIQIGNTWRLTSPLDTWANLSQFLLKSDIILLEECFLMAFKNGNPLANPEDENVQLPKYFRKETMFSNWSREGLIQSLILIGLYGEGLKIPNMPSPQLWVDNIILSLLRNANAKLWISLNHEMPLIAEASPASFIESVNFSLSQEEKSILEMFVEEDSFFSHTSNHTGLLWALEELAWVPEYLNDATNLLVKLSSLDPGGHLINRPINSLTEIYKPWHFQTFATFEERKEVLKRIHTIDLEIAWTLLLRMLPDRHGIAHGTHKMRWRTFDKSFSKTYLHNEIWETHSFAVDLLISIFDRSEVKFSQLIDESVRLGPIDRNKILEFAELEYLNITQLDYTSWHTIRKILSHHRSHPDMDWAISSIELNRYEVLYHKLEPKDTVKKNLWLFDDNWPNFPEGNEYYKDDEYEKGHEKQQKKLENKRIEGLKEILSQSSIEQIKQLHDKVKLPWPLGFTLSKVLDDSHILAVSELIKSEKSSLNFFYGFIFGKSSLNDLNWVFNLYERLKESNKYTNVELAHLFIPLYQSKELWTFIETKDTDLINKYWSSIFTNFHHLNTEEKISGITHLIKHKRFFTAINECSSFRKEMPTGLIVELLTKSATEKANEDMVIREYEIGQLFETLDERSDIDIQTMIQLEWLFFSILESNGTRRNPAKLHEELAKNPEFFVQVLKWIYVPKSKELKEEERKGLSDELILDRAHQAFRLLSSWKKIPGFNDDRTLNNDFLAEWVDTVRKLAIEVERLDVADIQIGQILAQYPEADLNWPPDIICKIIETINTDSLKRNFSSALFNKRGFTSRGPFDGGDIERGNAKYFESLAKLHKMKFPNVSAIFLKLSKQYYLDAKQMDENAKRDLLEY